MNRQLALFLVLGATVAACQDLNTDAASGGGINSTFDDSGLQGGNASPVSQGLVQCQPGSAECFALCGSPSCALADAAVPPNLSSPGFFLPDGALVTDACAAVAAESVVVRQNACAPCHQAGAQGGFNYVLDDAKLVSSTANVALDDAGMHLRMVIPGDPEHSFVYQRVMLGQMPPPPSVASGILGPAAAKNLVYPTAADETVLYAWIMCLAAGDGGPYAGNYAGATYGPSPEGGGGYWSSSGSGSGSGSGGPGGSSSGGAGSSSSSGVTGSSSSGMGGSSSSSSGAGSSSSSSSSGASSSSSSSSSGGPPPGCDAGADAAQYNFERFTQRWGGNGAPITGVAMSTAEAFAGCQSLAITFNGPAGTSQALVTNGPMPPAGALVTFHVWVPTGSAITGVQPFVQQNADAGFVFTGTFTPIAMLTAGAWNTITVQVPRNAVTPLRELGVEFTTNATWMGTVYVDSIGW
jgi:hypothetical protein